LIDLYKMETEMFVDLKMYNKTIRSISAIGPDRIETAN